MERRGRRFPSCLSVDFQQFSADDFLGFWSFSCSYACVCAEKPKMARRVGNSGIFLSDFSDSRDLIERNIRSKHQLRSQQFRIAKHRECRKMEFIDWLMPVTNAIIGPLDPAPREWSNGRRVSAGMRTNQNWLL